MWRRNVARVQPENGAAPSLPEVLPEALPEVLPEALPEVLPEALPEVLFDLEIEDLPKVGVRKVERLRRYGIESVRAYCEAPPSRIRDAFGSVDGERIWLAMHGHDVRRTRRTTPESMSHSRGLEPTREKLVGASRQVARSMRVDPGAERGASSSQDPASRP